MINPRWRLRTARLRLDPVAGSDLPDLIRLKENPLAFAPMLGGVRGAARTAAELAEDVAAWGRDGIGLWCVRDLSETFGGVTGVQPRADGRGFALRFALWPEWRGGGLAREAAGAALRYAHDEAGLARVVAVARWENFASRTVLGAIGMMECEEFEREGFRMVVYESLGGAAGI